MLINLKNEEEINGFKKDGKIAGNILKEISKQIYNYSTTNEINRFVINQCKSYNVNPIFLNYKGYPAAICASVNNIIVHGIPNDVELKGGDVLSVDIGVEVDGFIGDIADTFLIEDGFTQYDNVNNINLCRLALKNAISVALSGNKLSDISKEIYKIAKKFNFSIPDNYGGHGLDRYKLHSSPFVPNIPDLNNDITLRSGMVLAIEPMFILSKNSSTKVKKDGWSVEVDNVSFHCEHTVLITDDAPLILTE